MISNVNSLTIVTSSICELQVIVMSHWTIILTLYLWMLSSSQWRCQPGCFSMATHRHDRHGIYHCVLLRFRGRIEIDHDTICTGVVCAATPSTALVMPATRAVPGVAAQTTPAQTVSWSIPITIDVIEWFWNVYWYLTWNKAHPWRVHNVNLWLWPCLQNLQWISSWDTIVLH